MKYQLISASISLLFGNEFHPIIRGSVYQGFPIKLLFHAHNLFTEKFSNFIDLHVIK